MTTLVKVALGLIKPDSSRVIRPTKAEMGCLVQPPETDDNRKLLAVVMQAAPDILEIVRKLRLLEAEV